MFTEKNQSSPAQNSLEQPLLSATSLALHLAPAAALAFVQSVVPNAVHRPVHHLLIALARRGRVRDAFSPIRNPAKLANGSLPWASYAQALQEAKGSLRSYQRTLVLKDEAPAQELDLVRKALAGVEALSQEHLSPKERS